VGFESEYCEINSLILSSCSLSSAVLSTGVFGEFRNELELSGGPACLDTCPDVVTGGVDEFARPSLPLRSWALSSAARLLIVGRTRGVGTVAWGKANCEGEY
jgi:hypothetical protein